ncbi:MAG: hypothetical protein K0Q77_2358 [Anaerosporomusa subterranea]|jgi:methyl-accepting chemotaxis protein|nr:hypothetical protein [Anaerosporomusa subterranea]
MQLISNMKTANKILSLVAIMTVFMVCVGLSGFYFIRQMQNEGHVIYTENLLAIQNLSEIRLLSRDNEAKIYELTTSANWGRRRDLIQEINTNLDKINQLQADFEALGLDGKEIEIMNAVKREMAEFQAGLKQVMDHADAGRLQEAQDAKQQIAPISFTLYASRENLAEYNVQLAKAQNESLSRNYQMAIIILSAIAVIAAIAGTLLGWRLAKHISKPVRATVVRLEELAMGDFSHDVARSYLTRRDEFGQMASGFDTMTRNMRELIVKIQQSSTAVKTASEQLAASSSQAAMAAGQVASSVGGIAGGADRQAKAVDSTSSVVEEMSAGIRQISVNANETQAVSQKTGQAALRGGQAIEKSISQMVIIESTVNNSAAVVSTLGERSNEIGEIVSTISDIAAQTNLLALNAAIEAARAGEAGRGFAVVADEVRKLAEQSHQATQHIANIVDEIRIETARAVDSMSEGTREAKLGTQAVTAAGEAFREISQQIDQASTQMNEIASAIAQLASSSVHIVDSVREIDSASREIAAESQTVSAATEEQSAAMEEISASSQHLAMLADELLSAANSFQINRT